MTDYAATVFPAAYAAPLRGHYRSQAADFQVDELLDIPLSGQGEHLWLQVRKTGANTDWVAGQLARTAGIPASDVGYAGLKDRHAVTTQWFSMQLPGKADPDFAGLASEIEVLQQVRHDKKLRRGALIGNRFRVVLRQCEGNWQQAAAICQQINQHGVPNYYGEQRFGHRYGNLTKAARWFAGELKPKQRNQRSLYLSAARSWIFNHILAERVRSNNWQQAIAGDVFQFEGGTAWFVDDGSAELAERVEQLAIHPTGALWGRGELATQQAMLAIEHSQAQLFPLFCAGLEKQGLKQERRPLRVIVHDLQWQPLQDDGSSVALTFSLPAGAYATVVLEQLGQFTSQATPAG